MHKMSLWSAMASSRDIMIIMVVCIPYIIQMISKAGCWGKKETPACQKALSQEEYCVPLKYNKPMLFFTFLQLFVRISYCFSLLLLSTFVAKLLQPTLCSNNLHNNCSLLHNRNLNTHRNYCFDSAMHYCHSMKLYNFTDLFLHIYTY